LDIVFAKLRKHQLYTKASKCTFGVPETRYLGHVVGSGRRKPDPEKTKALKKWKVPENVHDIRALLGFTGYLRDYIPDFNLTAAPLTELTKKNIKFQWGSSQQQAFDKLRNELTKAPVLRNPDFEQTFIICTDASNKGVGSVLMQGFEDGEHPVASYSKKLTEAEQKYSTYEQELFALSRAILHWEYVPRGKSIHRAN